MRNYIKIAFVAAFAAIAGYGVYTSPKSEFMSNLALANLEALADGEISNPNCDGSWNEECCVCFKVHHTYAYANYSNMFGNCETKTGCSHYN